MSELGPRHTVGTTAVDHNDDEARRIGISQVASSRGQLGSDEVILTVRVFFHGRGAASPAQELEVLGSQPLNVLVDQISCLYDRPEVYSRHSWCDFNPCNHINFLQAVDAVSRATNCSYRERSFGHAEEAECLTKSGLLDRAPGCCKALFMRACLRGPSCRRLGTGGPWTPSSRMGQAQKATTRGAAGRAR